MSWEELRWLERDREGPGMCWGPGGGLWEELGGLGTSWRGSRWVLGGAGRLKGGWEMLGGA